MDKKLNLKEYEYTGKETKKIRVTERTTGGLALYGWRTLNPGSIVECTPQEAKIHKLKPVGEEEKPKAEPKKSKKADPKKEAKKAYSKELVSIEGIGKKTVKDIVAVYPTKASLIKAIKAEAELGFRDDVVEKLKQVFN